MCSSDLSWYVLHASPVLDAAIFFKTIAVLLVGERKFLRHVTPEEYEQLKNDAGKKLKISKQTYKNFGLTPPEE